MSYKLIIHSDSIDPITLGFTIEANKPFRSNTDLSSSDMASSVGESL